MRCTFHVAIYIVTHNAHSFVSRPSKKSWITLKNGKTTTDTMGDVWRGLEVVEAASRVGADMLVSGEHCSSLSLPLPAIHLFVHFGRRLFLGSRFFWFLRCLFVRSSARLLVLLACLLACLFVSLVAATTATAVTAMGWGVSSKSGYLIQRIRRIIFPSRITSSVIALPHTGCAF